MRNMDRAEFKSYLVVILGLFFLGSVGCGESPQQMFETAQFEELQNNQSHARELYERILQQHPDSEVAKTAASRLMELKKKSGEN